ncbi:MAG TPA: SRPBCC family protein [Mycobacteriales bacterium]|nr:SRPBCC family protein [Mycobacteriales bacterium]
MKLEHEFTVPASLDEAWTVLLDVERIAPCMPGASVTSVDGDDFTGTVKVKVGPIQVTYKGQAKFVEKDETAHRVVLEASGKEARGSGTAAATVTAVLTADGAKTKAKVETDLNITGRPAQFGRGVMADVGAKLIGQFANCLADELAGGGAAPPAATPAKTAAPEAAPAPPTEPTAQSAKTTEPAAQAAQKTAPPKPVTAPRREAEPIDLLEVAGGSVAKRAAPAIAAVVLLLLLILRRRRKR